MSTFSSTQADVNWTRTHFQDIKNFELPLSIHTLIACVTQLSRSSTTSLVVGSLPIDEIWMYAGLVLLPYFQPEFLLSAVLMSVWSVLNNSVTAEICLRVSPTTPGDCEKVVVIVALLLLLLLLLLLVCSCCCCYRCGREQCQFCAK